MIQLTNVSLAFGGQQILDSLTWTIKTNQSIGLIGPNGAGKSTLLRALAGRQDIDDGNIAITGGHTIGYLEQNVQEMPLTGRSKKKHSSLFPRFYRYRPTKPASHKNLMPATTTKTRAISGC